MAKETLYFPHDYNPTSDPKMMALLGEYGGAGYGIYWRIVEMLHEDAEHKLPTKQYLINAVAKQMHSAPDFILQFINDCVNVFELFKQEQDMIFCERVFRNINHRKEKTNTAKANAKARWDAVALQKDATAMQSDANKGNKSKGKENVLLEKEPKDINARSENFYKSLVPFVDEYGQKLVRSFFEYWSEANKSQTKMRWEMQKTFEIKKRLNTFLENDKKFHPENYETPHNPSTWTKPAMVL